MDETLVATVRDTLLATGGTTVPAVVSALGVLSMTRGKTGSATRREVQLAMDRLVELGLALEAAGKGGGDPVYIPSSHRDQVDAEEIPLDWTTGADGKSNSSPEYLALSRHVSQVIRDCAFQLIAGNVDDVAGLVVSQLAHVYGLRPPPPHCVRGVVMERSADSEHGLQDARWYPNLSLYAIYPCHLGRRVFRRRDGRYVERRVDPPGAWEGAVAKASDSPA